MVQIRVMGDDAERVTEVLEVLLPLLHSSTALVVGDPAELRMRGPGRRVVFELLPAGPGTVRVERVTTAEAPSSPARVDSPRQLPRGHG